MKTLKYIILSAFILSFASCSLDQPFYSQIQPDDYITNTDAVNTVVMGAYNALHGSMYNEWSVTELRTNNTRLYSAGSSSTTTKALEYLDQGTILSTSEFATDYWEKTYTAIARSNMVLEYLHVVTDAQKKAQFEGEAKFLRAYHYFNLVRLWGPVFKVTRTLSQAEARNMQRSPKEEIYELIVEDLEYIISENLLPEKYADADLGRVTLNAAKALLAKVYMTTYKLGDAKYADARTLLLDVLRSDAVGDPQSAADLVPYADIFDISNEMSKEIIFAVRYAATNQGVGSPFGNMFAPLNSGIITGAANSHNYPSDNIIAAFDANPGDLRKDVSLQVGYYNRQGVWVETALSRYVNKYLNPVDISLDGESDWPVIRVGDVILLLAEIENELSGPTALALQYLNMIRDRAGIPAYTSSDLPGKFEFRQALRQERRLELAFENQYFFDLLRWGIATQTINDFLTGETFYSGYNYTVNPIQDWQLMLPIPQSVMNINPTIAQNVGY